MSKISLLVFVYKKRRTQIKLCITLPPKLVIQSSEVNRQSVQQLKLNDSGTRTQVSQKKLEEQWHYILTRQMMGKDEGHMSIAAFMSYLGDHGKSDQEEYYAYGACGKDSHKCIEAQAWEFVDQSCHHRLYNNHLQSQNILVWFPPQCLAQMLFSCYG